MSHDPAGLRDAGTYPRLRPLDALARALVADAEQSSAIVRQLVEVLECADVVVYVRTALGVETRGRLSFVAHGDPLTYVLVRIDLNQGPRERMAALAHELTHAVEIAEASPPVRAEADLAALYRRIGLPGPTGREIESARAVANERQAKAEVARGTPTHQD